MLVVNLVEASPTVIPARVPLPSWAAASPGDEDAASVEDGEDEVRHAWRALNTRFVFAPKRSELATASMFLHFVCIV